MVEEINKLKYEIEELKNKNIELEEKLKSYTNPTRNKKYYDRDLKEKNSILNWCDRSAWILFPKNTS